ncbi:hypothetical protein C2E23DRAFT_737290 [Lenzites betulinus]|nr:hypothetical protein C2E23DRAFT_737290 [Lenzites betulinus]
MSDTTSVLFAPARASASGRRDRHAVSAVPAPLLPVSLRTLVRQKPRRAQLQNVVAASPLRPFVLADDRLEHWSTPHGERYRHRISSVLPSSASSKIFHLIIKGLEPGMRQNYGARLLRFTQFCDLMALPEDLRVPAPEPIVAAFVAHYTGTVRHDTIIGWLSGLAAWHAMNGARWDSDKVLSYVKKGARKIELPPLPKRPPVTLEHMHALFSGLRLTDTFDTAIFAVTCSGFWGCWRLGELTIPSRGALDPRLHVLRSAEIGIRTLLSGTRYAVFHIPWTKSTKGSGAKIILTRNPDPTDPVKTVLNHRQINHSLPPGAPLFAFETAGAGGWAPITCDWLLDRCNEVWVATNLKPLMGHCFRIGGTTELLLRGMHPDIVATQGGWKSKAFLEYWWKIEQILPLFISDSFGQSRVQLLSNTMDDYRRRNGL